MAREQHPSHVKGSHVSNTRHLPDTPPPSSEVAAHGMDRATRRRIENGVTAKSGLAAGEDLLAKVIGESVALHLGQLLGQLLPAMPWQPDCFFCLLSAKQVVKGHQVAIANAQAAGEEMPALPGAPSVNRAVTQVVVTQLVPTPAGMVPSSGSVWACWDHLELPSEPPRQSGLVDVAGRPIAARR